MSRRTSEANKAIVQAWEREKIRVSEGNGTRDWTPDQQKDILERGKAYDENGKAFEGQHMRSAEMYPEDQGNPNNIQFLTREEHLAAHDGSWKNPTNWYYDPVTKNKIDFGEDPIIPCREFELSDPLYVLKPIKTDNSSIEKEAVGADEKIEAKVKGNSPNQCTHKEGVNVNSKASQAVHGNGTCVGKKYGFLQRGIKTVGNFIWEHKGEIISGVAAIGAAGLKVYADSKRNGSERTSNSLDSNIDDQGISDVKIDSSFNSNQEPLDENTDKNYPSERSSPCEHDVSGYTRHQNGKEIHVNPYKRGGKQTDEKGDSE